MADTSKIGLRHAPSYPAPEDDKYDPTNPSLWKDVLDIASGKRREMTIGDRTIHSPNEGRGYRNMPSNPYGIAWAVKQYNGFGGSWRGHKEALTKYQWWALRLMRSGAVISTKTASEHQALSCLATQGYVQDLVTLGEIQSWDITKKGYHLVICSELKDR